MVWNRISYQVPVTVGTNAYTNKKNFFYNSIVQSTEGGGGYGASKVGAVCDCFVDMGFPIKIQVEIFWEISLTSGSQTLMCLTKKFLF